MKHRVNPRYWYTVQWSRDWKTRQPWTVGGKSTQYIGKQEDGPLSAWVFGPIAFMRLTMR